MSKFQKISNEIKEIEKNVSELNNHMSDQSSDVPTKTLKSQLITVEKLSKQLIDLQPVLAKYVKNAKITDEDRIIYGPKMVVKVLSLNDLFQKLVTQCTSIQERLTQDLLPIEQKEEKETEKKKRRITELEEKRQREQEEEKKKKETQKNQEKKKKEQEALKQKQAEEEKKLQERQMYEQQRDRQTERQKRLASAVTEKITPKEAFALLQKNCSGDELKESITALLRIATLFCSEPEKNPFQKIRVKNEEFQEHIASHIGGEECLISIGYVLTLCKDDPSQGYQWIMEEPSPTDLDLWSQWYASVTTLRDSASAALTAM